MCIILIYIILNLDSLFSEKFKLDTYYVGSHEDEIRMTPGVEKHMNEYGYMIWTIDTIVIDGKYDYQFFEISDILGNFKMNSFMF